MPVPSPFVTILCDPGLDLGVAEALDLEDLHPGPGSRTQRHPPPWDAERVGEQPPGLLGGSAVDGRSGDVHHDLLAPPFDARPRRARHDAYGERGHVV